MPLPFIIPAVAAAASWASTITFIGECALGGSAAFGGYRITSYVYNGVRDGMDSNRLERRHHELQGEIEAMGMERMQNLDETVHGIKERKQQLDHDMDEQQSEIQNLARGVRSESATIHRQVEKMTPLSEGLEQTARMQQALINQLQQELQVKQNKFEEAQKQLVTSNARLEEANKKLLESKEQGLASKSELALANQELTALTEKSREKDIKISLIESKVLHQEEALTSATSKIKLLLKGKESLSEKLDEANSIIGALTEQLGDAHENNPSRSSSPSFFK